MTTENNFTEIAETFKENIAKGMKWMQDTNEKLVETQQQQQMKTATDVFTKFLETSQFDGSSNLNNSFGASGKAMAERIQKNIETATNLLQTTMKPITEFPKFSDKDVLTNEINKQVETLNKQVADLTIVNQINFDAILKQFETTAKSFTPLTEQFKKEIEKAVESSKETTQTIINSYSTFTAPFIEANKETFEKLNDQIKTGMNDNIKFWSDLMNPNTPSTAKTNEKKVDNELLKISSVAGSKKYVNDSVK